MSVTGEPGAPPVKCGVPIADFTSGLYAAYAIAAALSAARSTGKGTHIDVSMFGCTLGVAALQTSEYFGNGKSPGPLGSAHPRNAPYQAFRAADGWFAIAAGNDRLWRDVCVVVDLPALATDAQFITTSDRAKNQSALAAILEERFRDRPVGHWIESFRAAGVPHSRINDYATALDDPQTHSMGWVSELTLPGGAKTKTFGSPLRFDGKGFGIRRGPPALGEHGDEVRAAMASSTPTKP